MLDLPDQKSRRSFATWWNAPDGVPDGSFRSDGERLFANVCSACADGERTFFGRIGLAGANEHMFALGGKMRRAYGVKNTRVKRYNWPVYALK